VLKQIELCRLGQPSLWCCQSKGWSRSHIWQQCPLEKERMRERERERKRILNKCTNRSSLRGPQKTFLWRSSPAARAPNRPHLPLASFSFPSSRIVCLDLLVSSRFLRAGQKGSERDRQPVRTKSRGMEGRWWQTRSQPSNTILPFSVFRKHEYQRC